MLPENIDDLFRDGLDGHATPPDPALWARLANATNAAGAPPAADDARLDGLFRAGLAAHATPPDRALWERLEDEHLRPPGRRRTAAWGPRALAAVVALLLVAGGAGLLWRHAAGLRPGTELAARPGGPGPRGAVATRPTAGPLHPSATGETSRQNTATAAAGAPTEALAAVAAPAATAAPQVALAAAGQPGPGRAPAPETAALATAKNNFSRRATRFAALASSGPSATKRAAVSTSVAAQPGPARFGAPDPQAPAAHGAMPLDAGALAVIPNPVATPASAAAVIEVEVRRGSAAPAPVAAVASAETLADGDDRSAGRRVLGGLLRQARHVVRGERVSLAEATGLPENLTLQANLGGRTLSHTIRL
ncbi:hypothetical protein [Hymenobacter nivis]|uniref:Uncharacterized protein n=1 Tax=Hymenobacter nivis TaxID=1850093 RepID=A0A2Z3GMA1_9BACT|nr:hypothetical protein [Hymenobacter nivis]AWM32045.1 hypothetical protein DDQ68_04085 [Hymenobacter nivis]